MPTTTLFREKVLTVQVAASVRVPAELEPLVLLLSSQPRFDDSASYSDFDDSDSVFVDGSAYANTVRRFQCVSTQTEEQQTEEISVGRKRSRSIFTPSSEQFGPFPSHLPAHLPSQTAAGTRRAAREKTFDTVVEELGMHYAECVGISIFFGMNATNAIVSIDKEKGSVFGAFLRHIKVCAPDVFTTIGSPVFDIREKCFFSARRCWWPLNHCLVLLFPGDRDACVTPAKFAFDIESPSTVDDGTQTKPIVLYTWPSEEPARGHQLGIGSRRRLVQH